MHRISILSINNRYLWPGNSCSMFGFDIMNKCRYFYCWIRCFYEIDWFFRDVSFCLEGFIEFKSLFEGLGIFSDNSTRAIEDSLCRAIILNEGNDFEILRAVFITEVEDIFHDGPLEAVDRLLIITDHENIRLFLSLHNSVDDTRLETIRILEFINHDILVLLTEECRKMRIWDYLITHHHNHIIIVIPTLYEESIFVLTIDVGEFSLFLEALLGFYIVGFSLTFFSPFCVFL